MKNFRLGATSFVFDNDLVVNAREMAKEVENVELVVFDVEGYGENYPSRAATDELLELAHTHNITYTVHLPADVKLGDAAAFDKTRRAIHATRALHPFAYVTHLDGAVFLRDTSDEMIARWQDHARGALQQVVEWVGDASLVCVENLERWNPDFFTSIVEELNVSRCVDIGHLWVAGCDPIPHLVKHLPRTRVIHLHGVAARDHQSLRHMTDAQLFPVIETLLKQNYRGVLTLEVFGRDDFFSSRDAALRAVEKIVA